MTRWLDDHEQQVWRSFVTVQNRLDARLGRQLLADSGLSMADFEVLVVLSDVPDGRRRAFELGRQLLWEKSRLSHHLTRMERRGLVIREGCPTDRRGAFIALTPAGRAALEAAAPGHVEAVRRSLFDVLTADQVSSLGEICAHLLAGLEPDAGCGDSC
ncbi:MAG: MarR family winged helix-turn-helix transcriptional regulator [Actinobacteria bacterium]|nr:MarR family winged helix-turn-helix transcriptional regulator [Actinomycetota bacterium]